MPVPLFDTATPLSPLRERIGVAIDEVVREGRFILGPHVGAFERELASYLGVDHVVGVGNGTDALAIALRALGIGVADEVVVPSFTFYATAEAIASIGARPVFCDVDPDTRNVSLESVKAALTPGTKAIVAVDLFGYPAPVADLLALELPVVEDAAQALGASRDGVKAGALGTIATLSFFPSKNLGCFGDGGAIATDDEGLAELARSLRFHGSRDKQTFDYVGYNSRLDELQAAILRILLPELDRWCDARRRVGERYHELGVGEYLELPVVGEGVTPAWHLYVASHPRADQVIGELGERGIQARGYYRRPLHQQPAMAAYVGHGAGLQATEELSRSNLALPMSPAFASGPLEEVASAIADAARALTRST
ncbi:MAG: DegT/DnrJ/EryC1/StrS family aminotransferase [Solirubrobacterales bacterium]|nr:DegT/DnrJ/EryC1/StrS family aminotransferase [Solirubrobacterales bacterium]